MIHQFFLYCIVLYTVFWRNGARPMILPSALVLNFFCLFRVIFYHVVKFAI